MSNGYKISKIASLMEEAPSSLVREIVTSKCQSHAISAFKMAMMNFDKIYF
jgi:hypothetical protein